jgi:predicted GIY-YIG superfamily endonuclease
MTEAISLEIGRHRKIQNIRESAPERIRSLIVEYLWSLEGAGHTYDNLRNIISNIKEYPLIYHIESSIDVNGILDMEEEYRSHFQERLHIETVEHERYLYLMVSGGYMRTGKLYTGMTPHDPHQLSQHKAKLLYSEACEGKHEAAKREREIKGWNRTKNWL